MWCCVSFVRDAMALARRVDLFSALTSEIRHAASTGEIRHFTTLLNSGDLATLLLGTLHAPVRSVDLLRYGANNPLIRTLPRRITS
jgi:hypothetical protein